MRFLIVNSDYKDFQRYLYKHYPDLEKKSYIDQYRVRMDTLFGTADFYSNNLKKIGQEAWDIIANMEPMQKKWAKERNIHYDRACWDVKYLKGFIPWPLRNNRPLLYSILEEQIKIYRPDVLYSMSVEMIGSDFLKKMRPYYRLAIGQHAAPDPQHDLRGYDLILSSLPNYVESFRQKGMQSELFHLGFEPKILDRIIDSEKKNDIVFIGGLGGPHQGSTQLLEALYKRFDCKIWGYGIRNLPAASVLHKAYQGPIWGLDMYQTLCNAKIAFNRHIEIAENYANNMRLYEATGVGTFLLTDFKKNLCDLFQPDRECAAYRTAEECIELVEYYLKNNEEREAIARAGQQRTLAEHTWIQRMEQLVQIVNKYL